MTLKVPSNVPQDLLLIQDLVGPIQSPPTPPHDTPVSRLSIDDIDSSGSECSEDEIEDLLDAVVNDVFAEVSYIQYVLVSLLNVTTRHLQGRRVHACAGFTG